MEKYLEGDMSRVMILDEKTAMGVDAGLALEEETTEDKPRIRIEIENPEDRIQDFREIERGFSAEQALMEATRCLRCDLERDRSES